MSIIVQLLTIFWGGGRFFHLKRMPLLSLLLWERYCGRHIWSPKAQNSFCSKRVLQHETAWKVS